MAQKRLRKSADKKIFGVCGGIAEYFDIDPTVVRLVWALAVLLWGAGLWIYIILAIVMPPADETTESGKADDGDDIVVEVDDVPEEENNETNDDTEKK